MDNWVIVLIIGIALLFIIFYVVRRKKILIYEDIERSSKGEKKSFWVRNKRFDNLNSARQYAKSLK